MRFVTEVTELSGKGMKVVQKSQTSPGYGYERYTPYPGTGTKLLQKLQNLSGTGIKVVQK